MLLNAFRRDTHINQFGDVMPIPLLRKQVADAAKPDRQAGDAAQRRPPLQQGNGGAEAPVDSDGAGNSNASLAPGQAGSSHAASLAAQRAQQESQDRALQQALTAEEEEDAAAERHPNTKRSSNEDELTVQLAEAPVQSSDPALRAAAARRPFPRCIPSPQFRGWLRGYVFKTCEGVTGYYHEEALLQTPKLSDRVSTHDAPASSVITSCPACVSQMLPQLTGSNLLQLSTSGLHR